MSEKEIAFLLLLTLKGLVFFSLTAILQEGILFFSRSITFLLLHFPFFIESFNAIERGIVTANN